ncbi:MFS transporter [Indioceanicola profundi]|uniref:MFS transporter n=1 Tax=Indioceanicola profundi TaxID=2220096 RepID=UPI000E6AA9B2|nr:MFS transporter [Indioceanicola profundi]
MTREDRSGMLSVAFSCLGHATMHILAALYLTVVLVLEDGWAGMSYDDLIRLWTIGSLMIGLGAPLAGWLGDRWSESRMMVLMFLLTGAGSMLAGLADTPTQLAAALAVLGLGASIYHPVGMSWVIKNARARGRALGILGIFGSVGIALAALIAGTLSTWGGWHLAFLAPGAASIAIGLILAGLIAAGVVFDRKGDVKPQAPPSRGDAVRAFLVLSVTMICAGLIFNATQTVLPKWFEVDLSGMVETTAGIGMLVTLVYLLASSAQFAGGWLSDKLSIRRVYVVCLLIQAPVLLLAAQLGGPVVLLLATAMVFTNGLQIPAENLLLARYTPERYRGLAYGAKFVLSFGAAPVAVQLVAFTYGLSADVSLLFVTLGILALTAWAAALLLPREGTAVQASAIQPAATGAGAD